MNLELLLEFAFLNKSVANYKKLSLFVIELDNFDGVRFPPPLEEAAQPPLAVKLQQPRLAKAPQNNFILKQDEYGHPGHPLALPPYTLQRFLDRPLNFFALLYAFHESTIDFVLNL